MLRIGNVELENNLILAPMAGVTDLPFRILCKEQGAGLLCMEMISAKAIYFNSKKTEDLMAVHPQEHPVSLQLFGSDPKIMGEIAARIEERPFEILDINMGCPMPKIVNNGEGAALMKEPKLVGEIVSSVVRSTKKPVTVKIRKGFDDNNINAVEIAKIIEGSGAAGIAVHGRTREQYYSGKADWNIIQKVKASVTIPVIGNGDLLTADDVLEMGELTGCDGFMIGRAAQGNPWIFNQLLYALKYQKKLPKPSFQEVTAMLFRHAQMLIQEKGEYTGIREIRKHAAWYTGGYKNSAKLRGKINEVENYNQLEELFHTVATYNVSK